MSTWNSQQSEGDNQAKRILWGHPRLERSWQDAEPIATGRAMKRQNHGSYHHPNTVRVRATETASFTGRRVHIDQLASTLLALDWDGDEVLNPRYR